MPLHYNILETNRPKVPYNADGVIRCTDEQGNKAYVNFIVTGRYGIV